MKTKKKFSTGAIVATVVSVVILAFAGFAGAIVFSLFQIVGKASPEADAFLEMVAKNDIPGAWEATSKQYRSVQSQEVFAESIADLELSGFTSIFWSKRSRNKDASGRDWSKLEGNAKLGDGNKIPVALELIRENKEWKVLSFRKVSEKAPEDIAMELKDSPELHAIAREAVKNINEGIVSDDFSVLYDSLASFFQEQTTPEFHSEQFTELKSYDIDFSDVTDDVEPVFTETPRLDTNGKLILKGEFPVHPRKAVFEMSWLYQNDSWKLISYSLFSNPNPPVLPEADVIENLTKNALKDLSDAFISENFTEFVAKSSVFFQQQYTAEQVHEAFAVFIENDIDISGAENAELIFTEEPVIDENGSLFVNGQFENAVNSVTFDATFLLEKSEWKMISINVANDPLEIEESAPADPIEDLISFLIERNALSNEIDTDELKQQIESARNLLAANR